MEKTKEKCWCGKTMLKDYFNQRIDIACPDYFFHQGLTHDHITKIIGE